MYIMATTRTKELAALYRCLLKTGSLKILTGHGTVLPHIAGIWKALTILNGQLSAYSSFVHAVSLK